MMRLVSDNLIVRPGEFYSLRDLLHKLEVGGVFILFVLDSRDRFKGIITDGDLRRLYLAGREKELGVSEIFSRGCWVIGVSESESEAQKIMRQHRIKCLPVVESSKLLGFYSVDDIGDGERFESRIAETPMLIMAGGFGKRLHPLTEHVPKPMVHVRGRPVLESIILNAKIQGIKTFFVSVHYKKDIIKDYFGDGADFGVSIEYIDEDSPKGTAGAIFKALDSQWSQLVVVNGDMVSSVDYDKVLGRHVSSGAAFTTGYVKHKVTIPYGVLEFDGSDLIGVSEKPQYSFPVNAGIYIVSRDKVARHLKPGSFDMPDLMRLLMARNERVMVEFIPEFWMDISEPNDLIDVESALEKLTDMMESRDDTNYS